MKHGCSVVDIWLFNSKVGNLLQVRYMPALLSNVRASWWLTDLSHPGIALLDLKYQGCFQTTRL